MNRIGLALGAFISAPAQGQAASQPAPALDRIFQATAPFIRVQMRRVQLAAPRQPVRISDLPGHRHPGHVLVYVIEGSVRSKLDDGPDILYSAGQSWSEEPGQLHRILNPVADSTAVLLVITIDPVSKQ